MALRQAILARQAGQTAPAPAPAPPPATCLSSTVTPGAVESLYTVDYDAVIGEGAFSKVYPGRRRSDFHDVAVKVIDKSAVDQKLSYVLSEIDILRRLQHPLIVGLYDVFEDARRIFIVMEYMAGGDLYGKITDEWPNGFPEHLAQPLIKKITAVVAFLHARGIVHRDLKPENILFTVAESDDDVRLTDFGMARMFSDDSVIRTTCGSPTYVAPEVIRSGRSGAYTNAVDMWSVGVIAFVVLSGAWPFYDQRQSRLYELIERGEYSMPADPWDRISAEAKDFVAKLLVVDPDRRMSAVDALQHPWLSDVPPIIEPGKEGDVLTRDQVDGLA
eukprot:TRINITY_DN32846_c0_g1_i1.p1 TRINITY_DN32846_c0_g1~~TRINITY_DN32846_c0_g1_i1.p1  ORF type:complete len:331 (+),score=31.20 TRINITY_DN32846_c0_g1_i1:111-1103(+)